MAAASSTSMVTEQVLKPFEVQARSEVGHTGYLSRLHHMQLDIADFLRIIWCRRVTIIFYIHGRPLLAVRRHRSLVSDTAVHCRDDFVHGQEAAGVVC
jgi:hypothetical protein